MPEWAADSLPGPGIPDLRGTVGHREEPLSISTEMGRPYSFLLERQGQRLRHGHVPDLRCVARQYDDPLAVRTKLCVCLISPGIKGDRFRDRFSGVDIPDTNRFVVMSRENLL